jgi:hypothetical protein
VTWINWIWSNFVVLAQAWSAVAWLLIGIVWMLFDFGSKIVCAGLLVKYFGRGTNPGGV